MITLNLIQAYCHRFKKPLQKEQGYKRWKSMTPIYRRPAKLKTPTARSARRKIHPSGHPSIETCPCSLAGDIPHRTTTYNQNRQTTLQKIEVPTGHSHDRKPTLKKLTGHPLHWQAPKQVTYPCDTNTIGKRPHKKLELQKLHPRILLL